VDLQTYIDDIEELEGTYLVHSELTD
jgi:hypothetical protein